MRPLYRYCLWKGLINMPARYPCENYDVCGNFVDAHDKKRLCANCCEIARNNDRQIEHDKWVNAEYKRLNQKPRKPTFREIEREVK